MPGKLSTTETLKLTRKLVGAGCKLHFEVSPLKVDHASKQYLYDDMGNEYLDCINSAAHVGHCHPHVVSAGQEQMAKLNACRGFLTDELSLYAKRLTETLPDRLCVCYFVNSGSEANDLALRLARSYTARKDVIVIDNAYHGNISSLVDISALHCKKNNKQPRKKHVHPIPCPDTYRGSHRGTEATQGLHYAKQVQKVIQYAHGRGRQIAAFISETIFTLTGVYIPPPGYLKYVYSYVREAGGLCIADEVQTGLGRTGDGYWSFLSQDVVPDILTCGKPLGNGHPMGVVVTTQEISDSLGEYINSFGGNPVSCGIGLAVLDVIHNEQLLSSAKCVGRLLLEGLRDVQRKHHYIGDVRGLGLMLGVDIVADKESKKPAPDIAEQLIYRLKQRKIVIGSDGPNKNVLIIQPPMCFTCENARTLICEIDQALAEIETGSGTEMSSLSGLAPIKPTELNMSIEDMDDHSDEDLGEGVSKCKQARYEDVD